MGDCQIFWIGLEGSLHPPIFPAAVVQSAWVRFTWMLLETSFWAWEDAVGSNYHQRCARTASDSSEDEEDGLLDRREQAILS